MKITNPHIQEAEQTFSTRNTKKATPEYVIIKLLKNSDKEKLLKKDKLRTEEQRMIAVIFVWKQWKKRVENF